MQLEAYYIYQISNTLTKDCYIGSTKNPITRWKWHINTLFKGGHNKNFQKVFDMYPKLSYWLFQVLEEDIQSYEEVIVREQIFSTLIRPSLNGVSKIHNFSRLDLDKEIFSLIEAGSSYRKVAEELNCSVGKVAKVMSVRKGNSHVN